MTDAPAPKNKGGRPRTLPPTRMFTIRLSDRDCERARELGSGNISQGVREAIATAWTLRAKAENTA